MNRLMVSTKPSRSMIGLWLLMIAGLIVLPHTNATNARAEEPLTFVGFDAEKMSTEAQEGMQDIFAGRLFHGGIPAGVAKMGLFALAISNKIGYDPNSPAGTFYALGNLPSPPQRSQGGGTDVPLGASHSKQNGVLMTNINCLACHAGVVNGQVVAGLGNNQISQSTPDKHRTRGDNFGPYGVWQLGAKLDDPANAGFRLARQTTELAKLFHSVELAPVDPQPWWLMK